MKYSAHKLGGLAAVLMGALPMTANAQSAAGAGPTTSHDRPASQASSESAPGGDIVVTARRREERLQDVPIPVTAISGESLQAAGITTTDQLAAVTPGLVFTSSLLSATPFLRGVGTPDSSAGAEASIATYVDGIYYPSMPGTVLSLANIERVEVLKGPQGTLFGRNATGGLIQVVTRDPPNSLGGHILLGYGDHQTVVTSVYVGAPIAENVGADISAYQSYQGRGYGHNLIIGEQAYRTTARTLASKIVFDNGPTTIKLAVDYSHIDSDSPGNFTFLSGATGLGGFKSAGPYDPMGNFPVAGHVEQYGSALTIHQDAGPVRLTSLSSYRHLTGFLSEDQDSTPLTSSHVVLNTFDKDYTQEFQIASTGHGPLQVIGGLFYMSRKAGYDPIVIRNAAGIATSTVDQQTTDSISGFAEATYEFLPRTHLTAGIRYTKDTQHIHGEVTRSTGLTIQDQKATYKEPTWRLILDHKFENGPLIYASYNRGFRSGLFNLVSPGPLNAAVKPEILDAYEAGFKWDLVRNRLRFNASVFRYNYKDIQLNQAVVGGNRTLNAAGARITGIELESVLIPVTGLTFQAGAVFLPEAKYTSFPNAPNSTPLPTGGNVAGKFDATGNRTIRSSKATFNLNGDYKFAVGANSAGLGFAFSHNSGFFYEPDNRTRQKPYDLLNGHISYTWERDRLTASLWMNNALNKLYYVQVSESAFGDRGRPAAPRTYGVSLEKAF